MEKVKLRVFETKPGMRIAQTIDNNFGAVIIAKGSVLDQQILERLESMGILEVEVFIEDKKVIKENHHENLYSKYEQNVQDMKKIMDDLRAGAPLDMEKVEDIMETIASGIYQDHQIVGPLPSSRHFKNYHYTHSINVSFIAMTIGKWMGCSQSTIEHLIQAGLLHDIGKSKIALDIVDKPGQLTEKEYEVMKQHPRYSYQILDLIDGIHTDVLLGILTHHEREDGTGYPVGVTSEKINLIGKIIAVADIYDAMTSERIYRKSKSPFEVFELMQNGSFGKLHPVILNKFIKNMSEYYHGSKVLLSNGEEGEVVFINYNQISKPIVKVGEAFIDLSLESKLNIKKIL